jgi:thymidylate kinase
MLITVSGLDGAGKSTLIRWLRGTLERDGHRITVLHLNSHVGLYAYARFIRDRLFGAREKPWDAEARVSEHRRRNPIQRLRTAFVWSKVLRELVYLIDLVLFLGYRFYIETLRRRVLIMDRYFYDSLVDVANGRNWSVLRFLERLTPTPDVAFLLDVPPDQAYGRKREQPFSYLERRWRAYKVVFPWIPTAVVLGNQNIQAAESGLYHTVQRCLARA